MAEAIVYLQIRDLDHFRLFVWELRMLADRMRIEACPHAEALERLVDRLMDADDRLDDPE